MAENMFASFEVREYIPEVFRDVFIPDDQKLKFFWRPMKYSEKVNYSKIMELDVKGGADGEFHYIISGNKRLEAQEYLLLTCTQNVTGTPQPFPVKKTKEHFQDFLSQFMTENGQKVLLEYTKMLVDYHDTNKGVKAGE